MGRIALIALAGVLAVSGMTTSVEAAPRGGVKASFRGRTIDLAEGWGDAVACAVYSDHDTRCYDSWEAMTWDQITEATKVGKSVRARYGERSLCFDDWFCLYEHSFQNEHHPGRKLQFQTLNSCQNLWNWNFGAHASSFLNNRPERQVNLHDGATCAPHDLLWASVGRQSVDEVGFANDRFSSLYQIG